MFNPFGWCWMGPWTERLVIQRILSRIETATISIVAILNLSLFAQCFPALTSLIMRHQRFELFKLERFSATFSKLVQVTSVRSFVRGEIIADPKLRVPWLSLEQDWNPSSDRAHRNPDPFRHYFTWLRGFRLLHCYYHIDPAPASFCAGLSRAINNTWDKDQSSISSSPQIIHYK